MIIDPSSSMRFKRMSSAIRSKYNDLTDGRYEKTMYVKTWTSRNGLTRDLRTETEKKRGKSLSRTLMLADSKKRSQNQHPEDETVTAKKWIEKHDARTEGANRCRVRFRAINDNRTARHERSQSQYEQSSGGALQNIRRQSHKRSKIRRTHRKNQ